MKNRLSSNHRVAALGLTILVLVAWTLPARAQQPADREPLLALAPIDSPDVERPFVYSSLDFPGATLTNAQGINSAGDIVGFYRDRDGRFHGFLLSGEGFRSIDSPGAVATDARGISPQGEIVGTYTDGQGRLHGYRLSAGVFTTVDVPGHLNTIAQRITATGTIVGCFHDTDTMGTMHGIVINGDGMIDFYVPASMHNGASPDGHRIAGLYTDMTTGRGRAYLLDNGSFMPFDVPESIFTAAWDMNPAGEIVGVYQDRARQAHGFLLSAGEVTSIDYPDTNATRAFGINPRGDVVGSYVDTNGRTHGFLLSRTRPRKR